MRRAIAVTRRSARDTSTTAALDMSSAASRATSPPTTRIARSRATAAGQGREGGVLRINLAAALGPVEGPAASLEVLRAGIAFSRARGLIEIVDYLTAGTVEGLVETGEHEQALTLAAELGVRAEALPLAHLQLHHVEALHVDALLFLVEHGIRKFATGVTVVTVASATPNNPTAGMTNMHATSMAAPGIIFATPWVVLGRVTAWLQ